MDDNNNDADHIISSSLWNQYLEEMHPTYELTGDHLKLLKRELEEDFMIDPDDPENEQGEDDGEEMYGYNDATDNFLKFAKKVTTKFFTFHLCVSCTLNEIFCHRVPEALTKQGSIKVLQVF